MAKIGIDCRMMGPKSATGIGNYIYNIVSRLEKIDSENEYFIFLKKDNFDLINFNSPKFQKILVDIHWYSWAEQIKFPSILRKYKLDLAHFPQFNVPLLYRGKFLVTIHDTTTQAFAPKSLSKLPKKIAFEWIFKNTLKKSAKILTVSNFSKQQIINDYGTDSQKIETIYCGVDKDFFGQRKYDKIDAIRLQYRLGAPYLFFTSVWRPHKNLSNLIKAWEILVTKFKQDINLVIGGQEDPRFPEVREFISKLPAELRARVIIPGFIAQDDLPSFYQLARLTVIPSWLEGFGLNGLEAMAAGLAVVCSKTGSLPEVYGQGAHYFNPGSAEDMAAGIHQVLNNKTLEEELIKKGQELIGKYSWEIAARQTAQVYNELTA